METTFDFGNKSITIRITGKRDWNGARTYFDLGIEGKANPIRSFYEIHSGSSRDNTFEINGRTFAYEYGFCDSKTKRRAVDEAVKTLAQQLAA